MVTPLEEQEMHFTGCCERLHWYLALAYAKDPRTAAVPLQMNRFLYGSLKGICSRGNVFGSLSHALRVVKIASALQFNRSL